MKTKITITLDQARSWFRSGNEELMELALQAFGKDELVGSFKDITTFGKACEVLGLNYDVMFHITKSIATISKASAAMFKLNIIRKALNFGQDLHLTKDPKYSYIYYPYNPFVTKSSTYYKREINSGKMEVRLRVKEKNIMFLVAALVVVLAWVTSALTVVMLVLISGF